MFTSLRSRLWLSYALIVVTALSLVTIVLFISLYRNPLLYRQTTERLRAVQAVLVERAKEPQAPSMPALAERAARTFNARLILFAQDQQMVYDTASGQEPQINFPVKKVFLKELPLIRDEEGGAWLYSIEKLPDGSFLMVASPRPRLSFLNLFSDEFMPVILFGGTAALLLSLIAAFLISGWIASPLQGIVNAARGMPSAEVKPVTVKGPREVQELTQAFNSMVTRVQSSQRSQREFVANVSHEMKTPLTSIHGFAQALLDGTANTEEARRQAAQVIFGETERMQRMVFDLLDLAKLDSGIAELKMSPVDMRALLVSISEKFTPQSNRAGVGIVLDAAQVLPPLIGDGDRLSQVFTNLIDNALKHTPRGGAVTVRVTAEPGGVKIVVADTGSGIPEADLPFIFQRFYRADPSRQGGRHQGAGLGLAIVQEIVLAHGGRISVRNETGSGASMEVTLPLSLPNRSRTVQ